MDNDTNTERIMYPVTGERLVVKVATTPTPWEVLTADMAREIAGDIGVDGWEFWADRLRAYAAAVDAMTAPTRLVYETE